MFRGLPGVERTRTRDCARETGSDRRCCEAGGGTAKHPRIEVCARSERLLRWSGAIAVIAANRGREERSGEVDGGNQELRREAQGLPRLFGLNFMRLVSCDWAW